MTTILDKKDQKLLLELCKNARQNTSELAKKVRISKEVASYRLQRLQKEGIVTKFIPLINFAELGYTIYRIQLKFFANDNNYTFLKSIPQTSWIVELQGNWDIVILFWAKTNLEFFNIITKIQSHYAGNIQQLSISTVHIIEHYPSNYLSTIQSLDIVYITGIQTTSQIKSLNKLETQIIEELMINARIPVLEIARKLNSSATNITFHLKKLIKNKVIVGFIPLIDYTKLGLTHFKVTLNLTNPADKKRLHTILRNHANVIYITESFGSYDLEFEFVTPTIQELFAFIQQINGETPLKSHEIIFDNKEILVNEMPR